MKGAPFRLLSHCMDDITTTHFLWTEKIGNFYKMGFHTFCNIHLHAIHIVDYTMFTFMFHS